jgi:hypothetical protein
MSAFDAYHKWLGIPPEGSGAGRLNHYRLLGASLFEADAEVIGSASDQWMAHLRSLQTGPHSELSQTLLNQVTAAKLCLLSPTERPRTTRSCGGILSARRSINARSRKPDAASAGDR